MFFFVFPRVKFVFCYLLFIFIDDFLCKKKSFKDKERQTHRQTYTFKQTQWPDKDRQKVQTQTDRHRNRDENRQIIVNFCVLQPQTVCENLDCLQIWFERIELIWSPDLQCCCCSNLTYNTNFVFLNMDDRIQLSILRKWIQNIPWFPLLVHFWQNNFLGPGGMKVG